MKEETLRKVSWCAHVAAHRTECKGLVRALRLRAEHNPPPAEGSDVARGDLQLNLTSLFRLLLFLEARSTCPVAPLSLLARCVSVTRAGPPQLHPKGCFWLLQMPQSLLGMVG